MILVDRDNGWRSLNPLDGRYFEKTKELREYFSESALIKYRVKVEVVYFLRLVKFLRLDEGLELTRGVRNLETLKEWSENLSVKDIKRVRQIEKRINHDVKAVEYLVREKLDKIGLKKIGQWVHWGLTSEDVNNLSYGMMVSEAKDKVLVKTQEELVDKLVKTAEEYKAVVMPARTHGQLAVPTTLGKEMVVFASRMSEWLMEIKELKIGGKLNGAVGNFNAHQKLYPNKNWLKFSKDLVESLGLSWTRITTQIEPGTKMVKWLDLMRQFNNVGLDLAGDMWLYIAFDYLKQEADKEEVGSSTMPQKVNPIDFENAEGNLELGNGMLMVLSNKLSVSRLQRDLSDSTVKRNLGVGLGYSLLAYKSLLKGLDKISPNKAKLKQELEEHPEMLAEFWQLKMRKEGDVKGYEKIKDKVRGKKVIEMDEKATEYAGLAEKLVNLEVRRIKI